MLPPARSVLSFFPDPDSPRFSQQAQWQDDRLFSTTMQEATAQSPYLAKITAIRRIALKADGSKETFFVTLSANDWLFEPGKAFGIFMQNSERMAEYAHQRAQIKDTAHFRHHVDLTGPLRHTFMARLVKLNPSIEHLAVLSSKENASLMAGAGLVDLLYTFADIRLPIDEDLPPLMPRYYSACNSPLHTPGALHFVFNMAEVANSSGSFVRYGVGSSYLRSIKVGDFLQIFPRLADSGFRLPDDPSIPIVMICAGTGVAPFIGFLQHRQAQGIKGNAWLYFGVRTANDFIFKDDIGEFVKDGFLSALRLATSRQEPCRHVQSLVDEDSEWLYRLMVDFDARIYICGDELTMIKDVNATLVKMCEQHMDKTAASKLLLEWTKARRVVRDIWV